VFDVPKPRKSDIIIPTAPFFLKKKKNYLYLKLIINKNNKILRIYITSS